MTAAPAMAAQTAESAAALVEPLSEPETPPPPKPWYIRWPLAVFDLACEHWFILGLGFAIGFAAAVPDFGRNGGWIAAQWTIKYGAVIIIFLLSGMSLKTRSLLTAATRLHVHLFIQSICLVLIPAIGYGIAKGLMRTSINGDLVNGLIVAMTMPTTISTNVVFTKQSGGNEAAALINAVVGNIIGIFVSPGWLYLYLGQAGQASYSDVIINMVETIIAPLVVGQAIQYFLPDVVKWLQEHLNFGKIGNCMIILLVWNTFCNTFHKDIKLSASSWVPMLFLEIGMFLTFCVMCLSLGTFVPIKRLFSLDKPDAVAILMCGSTKTLALGMPLITVMYGNTPAAGIMSLPLLIYHATQCLLGSLMIKRLKKWVNGDSPGAWPKSCWPTVAETDVEKAAAVASSNGSVGGGASPSAGAGKDGEGAAGSSSGARSSKEGSSEEGAPGTGGEGPGTAHGAKRKGGDGKDSDAPLLVCGTFRT